MLGSRNRYVISVCCCTNPTKKIFHEYSFRAKNIENNSNAVKEGQTSFNNLIDYSAS